MLPNRAAASEAAPTVALSAGYPSGTVTFAFTDIEGSTQRWERYPVAMAHALQRHDALVRAAIVAHGGHVFKTIGDAFCAAFQRAEHAVAAMLAVQRALALDDFSAVDGLRVRAAIHTGTADERDGDYFGQTVNRTARLLAIASGGQVLLSGVTRELVADALPAQASLGDLGEHRLKDLALPEFVHQLLAPDLAAEFPALRSLDALSNNLPLQMTSFVGRETELATIATLLETHRLVTLVGSGGIGKTRTSLQVAANLLDGSGDGVWFVEFAPLSNGDYIPTTVAQIFGRSLPAEGDPLAHLVDTLKAKRALLIFDNCEHLVEASARVIAAILRGCPQVTVLASSRQGLGIAGEVTFRLPSLAVPIAHTGVPLSAADAKQSAAIALFVERASANGPFELTDDNAPIVADICRRLDGIALAIELAASRVRFLSPKQLRDRLDERFRLLTGGSRNVLPRQQTLRALIDWSHDLLDERERVLFRRLGIFVNGFTLEAASAVASDERLDELDIFDVLASLVEKSLVLADSQGEVPRFRLLESTRAYAGEKLAEAGERERLASRHLRYLRDAFRMLRAAMDASLREREFLNAFEAELEDLRGALDGALERSDVEAGAELLVEIRIVWASIGLPAEGLSRLEAFIARLDPDRARLLAELHTAVARLHNRDNRRTLERESALAAVSFARRGANSETLGAALYTYANLCCTTNRIDEGKAALVEAEAIPNPSRRLAFDLLGTRAALSLSSGDLEAAVRAFEREMSEARAAGNARFVHTSMTNLAETEHARGNTPRAIALGREVLASVRQSADHIHLANVLVNLAGYYVASGDSAAAFEAAREVITVLAPKEPDHVLVTYAVEHLALACALRKEFVRAATLEGYVEAALGRYGTQRESTEKATNARLMPLLHAHVSTDDLARLSADGAALKPESAVALALEESQA